MILFHLNCLVFWLDLEGTRWGLNWILFLFFQCYKYKLERNKCRINLPKNFCAWKEFLYFLFSLILVYQPSYFASFSFVRLRWITFVDSLSQRNNPWKIVLIEKESLKPSRTKHFIKQFFGTSISPTRGRGGFKSHGFSVWMWS